MSTDDTNAARRGSGSNDLLGQPPVGALTDGEVAALIAWAETIAAQRVAAERERLRAAIEAKRCTPMFPGGHSFNYGIEAALDCVKA